MNAKDWLKVVCPRDPTPWRSHMSEPFSYEGLTCATEGHVFVAVAESSDAPPWAGKGDLSPIVSLPDAVDFEVSYETFIGWALRGHVERPAVCAKCNNTKTVKCQSCKGTKTEECICPHCDDEHDATCAECDGTGSVDCECEFAEPTRPGLIGGHVFNRSYLSKFAPHLPSASPVRVFIAGSDPPAVKIWTEHWRITLMSLVPTDEQLREAEPLTAEIR